MAVNKNSHAAQNSIFDVLAYFPDTDVAMQFRPSLYQIKMSILKWGYLALILGAAGLNRIQAQNLNALQSLSSLNSKQYEELVKKDPQAAQKFASENPETVKKILEQNPEAQKALLNAKKENQVEQQVDKASEQAIWLDSLKENTTAIQTSKTAPVSAKTNSDSSKQQKSLSRFGIQFFAENNQPLQLGRVIPPDYRLAEGDRIQLRFWGRLNSEQIVEVGADGYIQIDAFDRKEYVKGVTQRTLKETIYRVLEGMSGVNGDVQIIGTHSTRLRVSGAAEKPGSFAIPPFFTFWQALQLSGGPSSTGSVRDIRLVRNGSVMTKFDLYRYIREGTYQDMALEDGDQIHFGPIGKTVFMDKVVKNPAIYEMTSGEKLGDLIAHAGGLKVGDLGPALLIERTTPPEQRRADTPPRELIEVPLGKDWKAFSLSDGDLVSGNERSAEIKNLVQLKGEGAKLPGDYGFTTGDSTLAGVIKRAGGLHPGALEEIEVIRLGYQGTEIHHVTKANWGKFKLQGGDQLLVYHQRQFTDSLKVGISGAVRKEISVPWSPSMTLGDLIRMAYGLQDVALPFVWVRKEAPGGSIQWESVQLNQADTYMLKGRDQVFAMDSRRFGKQLPVTFFYPGKQPLVLEWSSELSIQIALHRLGDLNADIDRDRIEVYTQNLGNPNQFFTMKLLKMTEANLQSTSTLAPGMFVVFRRKPEIAELQFVVVEGEVLRPGRYPIQDRNEGVKEILERAGGFSARANVNSSVLIRNEEYIAIPYVTKKGKTSLGMLMVAKGDTLRIGRDDRTVKITGAVLNPGKVPYIDGWSAEDYINKGSGGLLDTANAEKIYVLHPNGQAFKADCGWFCSDPEPVSGSVIVVPQKDYISPEQRAAQEDKKLSFAEVMQGVTATLTTVLLVVILVNQL